MSGLIQLDQVDGAFAAREEWGANCGPVALAAALGLTLDEIRPAVSPGGSFRGHMGIRDIREAVVRAGSEVVRSWSKVFGPIDCMEFGLQMKAAHRRLRLGDWPLLVVVRFGGPWDGNPRASATYRHVICYRHCKAAGFEHEQKLRGPGWVLDAGQREGGAAYWLPVRKWANRTLLDLIPDRGSGLVSVDWIGEVCQTNRGEP